MSKHPKRCPTCKSREPRGREYKLGCNDLWHRDHWDDTPTSEPTPSEPWLTAAYLRSLLEKDYLGQESFIRETLTHCADALAEFEAPASEPKGVPTGYDDPLGFTWTSKGCQYRVVDMPAPGEEGHHYAGWLLRRHPDGQWVTMVNLRPVIANLHRTEADQPDTVPETPNATDGERRTTEIVVEVMNFARAYDFGFNPTEKGLPAAIDYAAQFLKETDRVPPTARETPTGAVSEPTPSEDVPCNDHYCGLCGLTDLVPRAESDAPASEPTPSEFLLCDETGAIANNRGVCPVHNGDACLWRYIKVADKAVEVAELRVGRAWHAMALRDVRDALIEPDEPEVMSPFREEVQLVIRGMVQEAFVDGWEEVLKQLRDVGTLKEIGPSWAIRKSALLAYEAHHEN